MEKVLERYKWDKALAIISIHETQHAYRRGKSTETALSSLIDKVEKALREQQQALYVFLHIKEALNDTLI